MVENYSHELVQTSTWTEKAKAKAKAKAGGAGKGGRHKALLFYGLFASGTEAAKRLGTNYSRWIRAYQPDDYCLTPWVTEKIQQPDVI